MARKKKAPIEVENQGVPLLARPIFYGSPKSLLFHRLKQEGFKSMTIQRHWGALTQVLKNKKIVIESKKA